jgi:mono/diheme cytochrome c family protein
MEMEMKLSLMMVALLGVVALSACKKEEPQPVSQTTSNAAVAKLDPQASVARGKYIVSTAGCHDCHTPWKMGANGPEPDMSRALSGHPASLEMPPAPDLPPGPWGVTASLTNTAWAGPWGTSFTANITSDKETGIGSWSKQNFMETIRNGRHMGAGRSVLPPMPAPVYAKLTDEDLGAVFDYLQTVPPISNKVPAPRPPKAAGK